MPCSKSSINISHGCYCYWHLVLVLMCMLSSNRKEKCHQHFCTFAVVFPSLRMLCSPQFISDPNNKKIYLNATCPMRMFWILPTFLLNLQHSSGSFLDLEYLALYLYNLFFPWKDVLFIFDFLVPCMVPLSTISSLKFGWIIKLNFITLYLEANTV